MKPTIPDVIDRFRAYLKRNPAWGSLHIVLEDNNVNDEHVRFCIDRATLTNDAEGIELGTILLAMSKTQRSKLGRIV